MKGKLRAGRWDDLFGGRWEFNAAFGVSFRFVNAYQNLLKYQCFCFSIKCH
ncbi:MAG: hypothetical protein QOH51_3522 [Acidobacteriota bacterium]|nr:hypothetical protein [Acidobacteriota bacterium]